MKEYFFTDSPKGASSFERLSLGYSLLLGHRELYKLCRLYEALSHILKNKLTEWNDMEWEDALLGVSLYTSETHLSKYICASMYILNKNICWPTW